MGSALPRVSSPLVVVGELPQAAASWCPPQVPYSPQQTTSGNNLSARDARNALWDLFFFLVSNDILNSKYLPCFLEGECKKTPEGKLQRNGHGVHTSANGMTYIGTWKNDKVILRIPSFQTLSGLSMVCVLPYPPLDAWKRKPLPEKNQINTRLFFH